MHPSKNHLHSIMTKTMPWHHEYHYWALYNARVENILTCYLGFPIIMLHMGTAIIMVTTQILESLPSPFLIANSIYKFITITARITAKIYFGTNNYCFLRPTTQLFSVKIVQHHSFDVTKYTFCWHIQCHSFVVSHATCLVIQ